MTSPVLLDVREGVAHLTLNRPDQANTFDLPTAQAFLDAIEAIEADSEARVVLMTGAGARFCAGGDVASFLSEDDPAKYLHELALVLDEGAQRLGALAKPVVAAVQGAAAGAGMSVMLCADVIVADRATKFLTAYAGIGLTPDVGLSWLLPRVVGQQRALDLLVNSRVLDAETAQEWGLITSIAETDVTAEAAAIAERLATTVPGAVGQARRLVRTSWGVSRAEAGADEAQTISSRVSTEEAQRLIEKFLSR